MPSSESSSSGVESIGSNSRINPSFVGTRINADGLETKLSTEGTEDADDPEPELECPTRVGLRDLWI